MNRSPLYDEIEAEIQRARSRFPPFHSQHEAYAVILEELDEYWEKVRRDQDGRSELIQVAAMCVAAIRERDMMDR